LALLKAEDDTAVIIVDGKVVSIEQQNIYGTNGDDILNGDRNGVVANDYIEGIGGNDQLYGKGGNDILDGGDGNDRLDGGDGNDHLYGGRGDDSIYSGTGADIIDGKITTDFIVINSGKDYLYIANYGDTANTTIKYTTVSDGKITGGSNNGTTFKNIDSVSFATGSGNDIIDISAASTGGVYNYNYVSSGAGDDSIIGGLNAVNYLYGGDGKDYIEVNGNGANYLSGGSGNDNIKADTGNDIVYGGEGNDYIRSGQGVDFIDGQEGNDVLDIYNSLDTANTKIEYTTTTNGKITYGANDGTTFQNIESVSFGTGSGSDNINISAATGNNYLYTGAGKDLILAESGNNVIFAGTGDDDIYTGAGSDTIYAGAGADIIWTGKGKDTIDGGDGNDFLGINNSLYAADIRIDYTSVTTGKITGGDNNGTTFKNIESVNFTTGFGNDYIDIFATTAVAVPSGFPSIYNFITTGAGNDRIYGGTGKDLISAGTGNDYISSRQGADFIDGGAGQDHLRLTNYNDLADTRIEYTTATNGKVTGGANNGTTFQNIESVDFTTGFGSDYINITAATGNNFIDASEGNNSIITGAGNDSIVSRDGNDSIFAGAGNDSIFAGRGLDTIYGGAGNDNLNINNSIDTADINITTEYFYNGISGNSKGTIKNGSSNGTTFQGIESVALSTGSGKDSIYLNALTGNASVYTNGGDDSISGGNGNDTIDAGTGNDNISGGSGKDKLYGGIGDDVMQGGLGQDYLDGGAGIDTFIHSYVFDDGGFGNSYNLETGVVSIAGQYNEQILNFENIILMIPGGNSSAGYAGNTVIGNAVNNQITTSGGDDTVDGKAGNDTISTSVGNDKLTGGIGNDTLYGGANNDTYIIDADVDNGTDTIYEGIGEGIDALDFGTTTTKAININLGVTITQSVATNVNLWIVPEIGIESNNNYIENVYGGSQNDTLTGNSLDNSLYGAAGNDTLSGGEGNDTLYGIVGDDTLSGGAGNDYLFGGDGNDFLGGGAGNDNLNGGANNDTYFINVDASSGEIDTINDTSGIDTIDFSTNSVKSITIDLSQTTAQTVATGVQLVIPVVSIENVNGGRLGDMLIGNNLNNTLRGGAGYDTLTGGAGSDSFLFDRTYLPFNLSSSVATLLGKDTITDFTKGQDKIVLSKRMFTSIPVAAVASGAIGADFAIVTAANDTLGSALAGASSASIVYNASTGSLFYNQDGITAGLGTNGGTFATLTTKPLLGVGDFSIVA
jgi:Ca2+-binding RTX toxin-like protein